MGEGGTASLAEASRRAVWLRVSLSFASLICKVLVPGQALGTPDIRTACDRGEGKKH